MNLVDIKEMNRNHVYQLIYQNRNISKPEIAASLNISLPTVSQCVNELKALSLVTDKGFFESTGGRKAAIISCNKDVRIAIGVEILKDTVFLVAVDLYGEMICHKSFDIPFARNEFYYSRVGNAITNFFIDLNVPKETLLGVGLAIQGLVNKDTATVTFGRVMDAEGFSAEDIRKYLPFNCVLQHDTELAASYALWKNPSMNDTLFLALNKFMGGAVIIDGRVHRGTSLPSGLLEHMTLVPDGKMCYCGKKGCVDAYCSTRALREGLDESTEAFFKQLRLCEPAHVSRWNEYLEHMSQAIYDYQILLNTEVMLSGSVAQHLTDDDIARLTLLVKDKTTITDELPKITVAIGENYAAHGAALYYITSFLEDYFPGS